MPFVPVLNVFKADMRFLVTGQECQMSQYIADTTDTPGAEDLAISQVQSLWGDLRLIFSPDVALTEIVLTDLSTQNAPGRSLAISPAEGGTNVSAGEALPNNVSLCVSFRTNLRGRSFRGRNYLPPLPEQLVDGNTVLPATVAAIVDAYEAFLAGVTGVGLTWVVVSRFSNGAPRVTGLATEVTSVIVTDPTVDSQRRRLPGRGR